MIGKKLYEGVVLKRTSIQHYRHTAVRTCSVVGQFEAGFIFEAHVAERSYSTIYAHKSLRTYTPLALHAFGSWMKNDNTMDQVCGGLKKKGEARVLCILRIFWGHLNGSHSLSGAVSARRAQRTKLRGPKGLQLEVGARRAPDFYIVYLQNVLL